MFAGLGSSPLAAALVVAVTAVAATGLRPLAVAAVRRALRRRHLIRALLLTSLGLLSWCARPCRFHGGRPWATPSAGGETRRVADPCPWRLQFRPG
jgi:hypothetical protein